MMAVNRLYEVRSSAKKRLTLDSLRVFVLVDVDDKQHGDDNF